VWCLLSFGYWNAFDAASINLSLNSYLDKYLEIIAIFDDSTIPHVSIDEDIVVNDLAQQASGFRSNQEKLYVLKKRMFRFAIPDVSVCSWCTMLESVLLNQVQQNRTFQN
jgi:hypothetical protein